MQNKCNLKAWNAASLIWLLIFSCSATSSSFAQTSSEPTFRGECASFYPAQVPLSKADRKTRLNVHILTDGTISQASVAESSGEPALDAAAVACAQNSKHGAVKSGGQAVEVDWQLDVLWRRTGISYVLKSATPSSLCALNNYPSAAVQKNEQGVVEFTYTLGVDGKVTNFQITKSTGFPDLDQVATTCVTSSRYPVATQAGHSIPTDMDYRFVFRLS